METLAWVMGIGFLAFLFLCAGTTACMMWVMARQDRELRQKVDEKLRSREKYVR